MTAFSRAERASAAIFHGLVCVTERSCDATSDTSSRPGTPKDWERGGFPIRFRKLSLLLQIDDLRKDTFRELAADRTRITQE